MELGLSLGDASKPFAFLEKTRSKITNNGFKVCMNLGIGFNGNEEEEEEEENSEGDERPVQLDLLPLAPLSRNQPSWLTENGIPEVGSLVNLGPLARGFDVNRPPMADEVDDVTAVSSPNSTVSSFQMDFSIYRSGNGSGSKRDIEAAMNEAEMERTSSRASDEEENGLTRKKLRLSKEQSAFLEESFKEHNTLNPKQKLALAKQLNLRPRQVEVWFQNRRARTKLKQTEVDCEYLKRCCETLTEENRRLQKELQELRALKTSQPFYMQLPATTLTMCPSCERVATTSTNPSATPNTKTNTSASTPTTGTTSSNSKTTTFSLSKPRLFPFAHTHTHQPAAS